MNINCSICHAESDSSCIQYGRKELIRFAEVHKLKKNSRFQLIASTDSLYTKLGNPVKNLEDYNSRFH